MKKLLFTSFIFLFCLSLSAQKEVSTDEPLDYEELIEGEKVKFESRISSGDYSHLGLATMPGQQMMALTVSSALSRRKMTYDEVKGSPYLMEKPVHGIIVKNNGDEIVKVPLKVDLYSQTIVATNLDGKDISLNPKEYKSIILPYNNQILTLEKVNIDEPDIFYAVLYQDPEILFFREDYATFKDATSNGISDTEASFTTRKNYYIKHRRDKHPTKVKLKDKYILKSLPKRKADSILRYIKKNKLKLQSEEDFIKAFIATKSKYQKS